MRTFTGKYRLEIGEPAVIAQGEVWDQNWGHYCFPGLRFTKNGGILAKWTCGEDDIDYSAAEPTAVSDDGGKTWRPQTAEDVPVPKVLMKNGKYFAGFTSKGAHHVDYFGNYTPAAHGRFKKMNIFFAEDITDPAAAEDKRITAGEYDPATGETEIFDVTVRWPYAPLHEWDDPYDHFAYPMTQLFAIANGATRRIGDDLYHLLYTNGFDSTAKSREEAAAHPFMGYYHAYIFKSSDCGRTWDFVSQLNTDEAVLQDDPKFEGIAEPIMGEMPDGSVVMLMRTGWYTPSYFSRSTDGCKTWSKPVRFDECGVYPQILTLPCGVTLATYGRPKMKIRATADPSGLSWDTDILFPLSAPEGTDPFMTSCFYTNLLPLDDTAALWIYTDFRYPNENGDPARAVIARTLTVVPE